MPLLKELMRAGVYDGRSSLQRSYILEKTNIALAERIGATAILIGAAVRGLAIRNSEGASTVDLWKAAQWIFEHSKQPAEAGE